MILQDAGPNQTDGHYAMNQQEGEENESFISQQGNGARNAARAYQAGESNQAKQYQTATAVVDLQMMLVFSKELVLVEDI